jgi:hypothetical protein
MQAPHRVRRLRWQARAGDAEQAFALRALLRDRREVVEEALDRVLDAHMPRGEVWKLPRVELRLRADSVEALGAHLAQWVAEALAESLRGLAHAGAGASAGATSGAAPATRLDTAQRERALLLAYFASGQLDWTLAGLPAESVRARLRDAARSLADAPHDAVATWPRELSQLERWIERWLALLPADSHRALAEALLGASGRASAAAVPVDTRADAAARAALARRLARATLGAREARPPLTDTAPAAAMSPRRAPQPATDDTDRMPSLLVPAAGLVLLHPFVPRLFAACKLVTDERSDTIDDAQRPRAAALLHWLAHGDAYGEALEFELPFVKLLLGLAPDDALAPHGLTDSDRAEGEALLQSVIAHWSALRNTGIDALRVNFLQRRGLLEARDGAWHLRVQTEAFDMLVALLPWGIGFVRLPWMTRPLITDWPTP